MYLHIGQNEMIPDRRIIGIFDLDKATYSRRAQRGAGGRGAGYLQRPAQVLCGV